MDLKEVERHQENGRLGSCDACNFEGINIKPYRRNKTMHREAGWMWICFICANTKSGTHYQYPGQDQSDGVIRMLAWIGNALLSHEDRKRLVGVAQVYKNIEVDFGNFCKEWESSYEATAALRESDRLARVAALRKEGGDESDEG